MSRNKPYSKKDINWCIMLTQLICIPMSQRSYEWGVRQIKQFLSDIFYLFEETAYIENMGSLLSLCNNNIQELYDGQQRLLTTLLTIISLSKLVEEHEKREKKEYMIRKLSINKTDLELMPDNYPSMYHEIYKTYPDIDYIPNIYCINPHDRKALVDIFNDRYIPFSQNIEYIYSEDKYKCKHEDCGIMVKGKDSAIRHQVGVHGKTEYRDRESRLYSAFDNIYDILCDKIKDIDDKDKKIKYINDIYSFIIKDIDFELQECNDPHYASLMFGWNNGRGIAVNEMDVVKNNILRGICDENKYEVYDNWTSLYELKLNKIQHYGRKLFDIAISVMNNHVVRKEEEVVGSYEIIFKNTNVYESINTFFNIIRRLHEIMIKLSNHKTCRLILNDNTSGLKIAWEGFKWCILPIFYIVGENDRLIDLFVKWAIRNSFTNDTLNKLAYSEELIKVCNIVMKDSKYDYYEHIKDLLKDKCYNSLRSDSFNITWSNEMETYVKNTKQRNSVFKTILMYLEIKENTDTYVFPDDITLEHIVPQSSIEDCDYINYLGNLTLLEGKNSENGHRGNFSIKDIDFTTKKETSYEKSNFITTRDIAANYTTDRFTDDNIIDRTNNIIDKINTYTNYMD